MVGNSIVQAPAIVAQQTITIVGHKQQHKQEAGIHIYYRRKILRLRFLEFTTLFLASYLALAVSLLANI